MEINRRDSEAQKSGSDLHNSIRILIDEEFNFLNTFPYDDDTYKGTND